MNKQQFKELIIDVLTYIGYNSGSAVNLLMGTAAQESHLGEFIKQIRGPAEGIMQMEPPTFDDNFENYLKYNPVLQRKVKEVANISHFKSESLRYNLALSIAMARVHYLRRSEPLPDADDIGGLARYWKKYYNTYLGKGTEQQFVDNYKEFVL